MKILIIGLGSIATKHINALNSQYKDITFYAYRSKKNASKIDGIINLYELDELNQKFDFAIISNPTNLHAEFIKILANKNIDLFIEKPPVHSLNDIEKLISTINDSNIQTYVACNLRFNPCIQFLKKYLSTNTYSINEVNIYCGSYLPDWRPNKDYKTIYSANAEMGGGVHLDLFHELDYTHWLFGKPLKSHSIKRSVSTLNINAFDYANYILEYEKFTANIVLNYYRKDPKRIIEIVFENETFNIDLIKNRITDSKEKIIFESVNYNALDAYKFQMENFITTLKSNQKQINTFIESIEILKTCLA